MSSNVQRAINTIQKIAKSVEGLEINIQENHISVMYGHEDKEFIVHNADELLDLILAIKTIIKYS